MESFYSINFTDYYYWPCEFLCGSYVIQLKLARAQFCSSIIFPNFWPCAGHYTLYLHAPPSQLSVLLPFFCLSLLIEDKYKFAVRPYYIRRILKVNILTSDYFFSWSA